MQVSASADSHHLRQGFAGEFELRIGSKAALNGLSTTMTALVRVDGQGTTAVNSVRVRKLLQTTKVDCPPANRVTG